MLQQVLEYLNNPFTEDELGAAYHIETGTFTIADGMVSLPFLLDGQRFAISGSVLNDGVYTYHEDGIKDDDDIAEARLRAEVFSGSVLAMAVPPAVIALSEEIRLWVEKYGDTVNSPYQSESFGGYSYTRASGNGTGGNAVSGWQDVFGSRLKRWRKIC